MWSQTLSWFHRKAKLKAALQVSEDTINITTPLIDLGVDSLVAVDIRTWFAQEVGADVAVLKILGGPSIQDLVEDVMIKMASVFDTTDESASETSSDDKSQSTPTEVSDSEEQEKA